MIQNGMQKMGAVGCLVQAEIEIDGGRMKKNELQMQIHNRPMCCCGAGQKGPTLAVCDFTDW